MNQRVNYLSMGTVDPYGNMTNTMLPSSPIQPSSDLMARKQDELATTNNNFGEYGKHTQEAQKSLMSLKPLEKPEDVKVPINGAAAAVNVANSLNQGKTMFTADQFKGSTKNAQLAGAGVGAATAVAGIAGGALSQNKHEIAGGALSGASTGAGIGTSILPGWGTLIGAGVGAIAGGVSGKLKQDKRIKDEKQAEKDRLEYNKEVERIRMQTLGQAEDMDMYQSILDRAKRTNGVYRRGGLIRYGTIDVEAGQAYLDSLKGEKPSIPLADEKIFRHGGIVENATPTVNTGAITLKAPVFKRGGKAKMTKCKQGCTCDDKKSLAVIFRRGGVVNLNKENVIIDGPSHEEHNNTGVNGDRGLPVVYNGKKVAEIESDELVINAVSAKEIEILTAKALKGDKEAEKKLGELVMKELHLNTHDYSNLLD